jgi:hypothetical protein
MLSGDGPGLQNRRAASLMSPVRSTRTRFRQFIFREMWRTSFTSQVEIVLAKQVMCDKNVINPLDFFARISRCWRLRACNKTSLHGLILVSGEVPWC